MEDSMKILIDEQRKTNELLQQILELMTVFVDTVSEEQEEAPKNYLDGTPVR